MTSNLIVALIVIPIGILTLIVLRRSRRTCKRNGGVFHTQVCYWGLFMLGSGFLIANVLASRGWPWSLTFPLGALGTGLGLLILIILLAIRDSLGWRGLIRTPQYALIIVRALWRIRERADFAAARRASGQEGRLFKEEGLVVWTDSARDVEAELKAAVESSAAEFARLTGFTDGMPPLRAIIFEQETGFLRYTQTGTLLAARHMGNYNGGPARRMTVCCELSELFPSTLHHVMIHETTHHLLWSKLGRQEPAWLQEGMATLVASRTGKRMAAPGAALRNLLATQARRELLTGAEMFSMTYAKLGLKLKEWRNTREIGTGASFYLQSYSFAGFLYKEHTEAFQEFLKHMIAKKVNASKTFLDCFNMMPDEAMSQWIQWVKAPDIPDFVAPPKESKLHIERELVAKIRDAELPLDDRLLAIRRMGAAGYPWGVSALIEVMESCNQQLCPDAQRALENIAGETRGSDTRPWREWLEALPVAVTGGSA